MSDRAAILRAVCTAPDDDAPRLILADYLQENGDEARADLIRWMIRARSFSYFWSHRSKHGRHIHHETKAKIRGLNPALTAWCRDEWGNRPEVEKLTVRRGFVEAITMTVDAFMEHAAALFAVNPITEVHLRDLRVGFNYTGPPDRRFFADLVNAEPFNESWPAELFPEEHGRVHFKTLEIAMQMLSLRACAYGRWKAGILREPPPLPVRKPTG
jgi:uncharacterized protein (TIGR02996 family)